MGYKDYECLFDEAQTKGNYHIFTIDGKGFRKTIVKRVLKKYDINLNDYGIKMKKNDWKIATSSANYLVELGVPKNKLINFSNDINEEIFNYIDESTKVMQLLNKQIEQLEQKKGRKILHENEYVIRVNEYYPFDQVPFINKEGRNGWGITNPSVNNHDAIHFIFKRGEVTYDQFKEMYINAVTELNITDTEYYLGEGYYETDLWVEGDKKLFREYAVNLIENRSKQLPAIKARTKKEQQDYLNHKNEKFKFEDNKIKDTELEK